MCDCLHDATCTRVNAETHCPGARGPSQLPGEAVGSGFIAYIDRGSAQVEGSICGLYGCTVGGIP